MSVDLGTGYLEVKPKFDTSSTKEIESKLSSVTKRIGGKMQSVGKGLSIGLTAPLVLFGKASLSAFEESSKVASVFAKTLDNVGLAGKINADKFGADMTRIGESIGVEDEALVTLGGKLASAIDVTKFGGDAQKTLEQITLTVQNMSVQTGKSANTYAKLFASLANDPKAALGPLTKLGVITKDQADKYKKMIDNGKGATVQQDLLTAANKKFAGAAKAASTPSERLAVVFGNFQETIGQFLMPMFESITQSLTKIFHAFQNLSPGTQKWIVRILVLLAALGPFLIVLGKVVSATDDIVKGFTKFAGFINSKIFPLLVRLYTFLLANPFILIAAAVVILAIIIYKNWGTIKKFLLKVWDALKKAWNVVWNTMKHVVITVFNALKVPVLAYFHFYRAIFRTIIAVGKAAWNAIKAAAAVVWHAITAVVSREINGMKRIFNVVKDAIITAFHAIRDVGKGIWDIIVGAAQLAFNGLVTIWNNTIGAIAHGQTIGVGPLHATMPDLRITPLAQGGIVTGPTIALLGEASNAHEAVIPLPPGFDISAPKHMTGTLTLTPESRAYVELIGDDDAGGRARHARVLKRMGSAA